MARHEPLPASDVDTGIVWADHNGCADLGERIRESAARVLNDMEKCGLRRCPDGANADNPLFSRSRSAWAAAARTWITDPTREGALLLSSIVADSRPITEVTIGRAVTDTIRETTCSADFLDALLRFTLTARPPVGFIRDFVVEHSGEHRGGLDLKRGGLLPISALARWLAIALGEVRGSTTERLSRAAAAGLLSTDEAETLAGAFKDVYELLLWQEVAAIRDCRPLSNWIAPRDLDPLTRRLGPAPRDRGRQRPPRPGCLIPCHPVSPASPPGRTEPCCCYTFYYSGRNAKDLSLPERALTCGNW
jgi:CBS domain-containing protein